MCVSTDACGAQRAHWRQSPAIFLETASLVCHCICQARWPMSSVDCLPPFSDLAVLAITSGFTGGGLEDLNSRAYTWTLTHWAIFPVWAIDLFKIGVLEVVLALLTSNIVFSLVWFWISYIEWASLVWTHAVACCWGSSPQQPNHTFLYVLSTQFIFKN